MSVKQKPVIICDSCGKEINTDEPYFKTYEVPNEGCSYLEYNGKSFDIDEKDYCDMICFIKKIKEELEVD